MQQKKPLSQIIQAIKKQIDFLTKFNQDIIKKLSHFAYPIKHLLVFYQKQLLPKLTARQNKSYIFSDIMIWYANKIVGFVYKIQDYIISLDTKVRKDSIGGGQNQNGGIQKTQSFTVIPSTLNYGASSMPGSSPDICIETNQILTPTTSVQTALRMPSGFLTVALLNLVKNAINYCQEKQYIPQKQSLTLFVKNYEKCLKQYTPKVDQKGVRLPTMTLQQVEQIVKQSFYQNITHPKSKISVKFGLRFLFIAKLRLRVKKANKHINQRKMRIKQLIDGQKKYIDGLKDYIDYIKKPIQATKLAAKDQLYKMFSTIEPILVLHTDFHDQLVKRYANYTKYQIYGDLLMKKFPYFQIYIQYIQYADEAQATLLRLAQQHGQIQQICDKFMREKQKKASDQLKQPTFRIARYQMIIKEIIKNTNPIHPDYQKLIQAQKEGINMLRKINETVDITCRRNRLNQLQQEYGTQQRPVFMDKRQFLQQFQLFYVHEQKLQPVTVLVFNDILIVVESQYRKIIKWIKVDQNFYVRRQQDNKIYRNIIKIHSDGFLTFSAGSEDKHFNKAEQFYQLLQRVSKQNQQNNKMVYVQVIGTEQIGSTSFAKHTQYVIQIKYLGLRKFVHLRFSQMQPFVTKIQNYYQNDLNISRQQALKKNWFNNHKSKTIQDRKRTIQQILQKLLNHQLIKKDPEFILEQLKIDTNFFKMTQQYRKRRLPQKPRHDSMSQQEDSKNGSKLKNIDNLNDSIVNTSMIKSKRKQYKQAQTILCATQIKLGRDLYHDPDDIFLDSKKTQAQKIQIQVHTMVDEDPTLVSITQFYTVEDVCHKVSKLIGLRMNRDFRLFHEIGKKQLRVLDQQQKLMKIFSFPKKQVKIGFIFQLVDSMKKIVAPDAHPKLVFKKYYFLPVQIQQSQCRKDLTRLRLLVYQIFAQIKQMKYQLSFDEYLLFLAMLIYIQYDGQAPQKIPQSYVYRLIPQTIFKLKNYTQQQWLDKCKPHLIRLKQQINKIIDYNRQQLKNKKIKTDSVSKTALHFGHRHLCSQIVINKIKSNTIYGSNLFYVQPYRDTYQKLVQEGRKMAYNMWLAIKVQSLNLLTPSTKQTVLQLKYKDIQKIFVYSQAIIFKMQGISTCVYRFNTYQSFEISQLVKYNKCLNETLQELEKDQDLISKARMYKQESLIYRNTYDQQVKDLDKSSVVQA